MPVPPMSVLFFKTESGNEPVKEWLKEFQPIDKKNYWRRHSDYSNWLATGYASCPKNGY